jgi:Glycosyl hydrolases family 39
MRAWRRSTSRQQLGREDSGIAMKFNHILVAPILSLMLITAPMAEDHSAVSLKPPARPVPAEFFGMHFHHLGGTTPWPNVPVAQWRLWDANVAWPNLEPAKNRWRFETLDAYVALASEHHVGLVLPLGLSPAWASARPQEKSTYQPGFAAEPRDIEDWRMYVRTVARHCAGRIQAYEIWNEPNLKQFWSGTVDQMVELTREASLIIRSVDPQALIISPSATQDRGTDWLAQFLRKGGGEFVDVIGYHLYVAPQPPEATVSLVSTIKRIMQESRVSEKPIWNTEAGWFLPKPFPADRAAAYVVREFIVNWAAGVQRLYWYAWDNHGWVSLETTESDSRTLKPAGQAYAAAFRWLVGSRMLACSADGEQTWICEFERDGSRQRIIWSVTGPRNIRLPSEWHVQNKELVSGEREPVSGDELGIGPEPVLVSSSDKSN